MSDVSVIGLGNMGSALASACLDAGHRVTVYNRSLEPRERFVARGAQAADSPCEAVLASPLTILCVTNYRAVHQLFDVAEAEGAFSARTVVNLTGGTPAQALAARAWLQPTGAGYLDGHINGYPFDVGDQHTSVTIAGPHRLWEHHKQLLLCLGGASMHVGEDIAAANALTVAWSTFYHVALLGFFEALAYARAADIPHERMLELAPGEIRLQHSAIERSAEVINSGNYQTDQSTVALHRDAIDTFKDAIEQTGAGAALLTQVAQYVQTTEAGGKGQLDLAAVFETMQPNTGRQTKETPPGAH